MKTSIPCSCFLWCGIVATVALAEVRSETAPADLLEKAESRLRAVDDRDEFRPKRFQPMHSLLQYVGSNDFQPKHALTLETLRKIL